MTRNYLYSAGLALNQASGTPPAEQLWFPFESYGTYKRDSKNDIVPETNYISGYIKR